ncbi:MAG: DUF1292 domain-containing protein [Clostridia bacterium]|nr:DUF1292 domain-containing protein [Clostridia bacterium]
MADEIFEGEFYTLTDEEGNESQFELIGSCELDGKTYMALVPVGEDEVYVILRSEIDENGEESLVTIDDDDEFDRVADIFDDELFSEVDYDAE